jgi:hypothetical protein
MANPTTLEILLARAADARATADTMHESVAKETLLGIAAAYETMARHAASRASTRRLTVQYRQSANWPPE